MTQHAVTPQILTPGRWRGLHMTSTPDHVFMILAFDQRGTYRKMLPEGSSYESAVKIKHEIVATLEPYVSAVLLDSEYGYSSALNVRGLLMSMEKSGYSGDATYRRMQFDENWTAAKIKKFGASAIKVLAYYHPDSGALAEEIEGVLQNVIAQCHAVDLPIFLEPMSYSLDKNIIKESEAFAKTRPHVIKETARRLGALRPDVLKLEFPVDIAFDKDLKSWQAECEAVSAVCNVPWVLLSAGVDFETFQQQTKIACTSGASGYLAGRAIWKEAVTMTDEARQKFLAETAINRLHALNEVAAKYSRPWTDFYKHIDATPDWVKDYA